MLTLGDNFSYQGAKPLDARLKYDTVAAMKAVADSTMYEGCLAYCVATDKTYQWKSTNTVDATLGKWRELSGGGHSIEDSEGTILTQRDTMQFGDGFNASDDSENEKTVVEPNLMTAADMDDVVTPLPSVQSRYHKYSTEEQIVGEWIDGKPLYQKTFVYAGPITWSSAPHDVVIADLSSLNIDNVISAPVGSCIVGSSWSYLPWALIRENIQTSLDVQYYNIEKELHCRGYRSNGSTSITDIQVTIQYTKTTD